MPFTKRGIFAGKLFGQVHGFVQDDFGGVWKSGVRAWPDGGWRDRWRRAFEAPVFRVLYDDFVEDGDFFRGAFEQAIGEGARGVGGFGGTPEFCSSLAGSCWLMSH